MMVCITIVTIVTESVVVVSYYRGPAMICRPADGQTVNWQVASIAI